MESANLRESVPRRWSEQLGGIRWLPRLIDKARSAITGQLGAYLFGQSPVDSALLKALGLSHRAFATIVKEAPDDAAVFTALEAAVPDGIERARAWSARLPRSHRLFLMIIDIDDGYTGGPLAKRLLNVLSNPFTAVVKRAKPSRAAEFPS